MGDIVDRAQAREAEILADSLARMARELPRGESLASCEDCGDDIPQDRREAIPGCRRCVFCQDAREQRKKGYQERT